MYIDINIRMFQSTKKPIKMIGIFMSKHKNCKFPSTTH